LDEPNPNSLSQLWQIVEVNPMGHIKKDAYEFVHTRSTLVLEKLNFNFFLKTFKKDVEDN
jgi:hypothetical protein